MIRPLALFVLVAVALFAADDHWFDGRLIEGGLSMLRQMRHAFGF
jgi:hypothetical protein